MTERYQRVDLVLALVLTASGVAEAVLGLTGTSEPWWVVLTVPLVTLPVLGRRSRTTPAFAVFASALLLQALMGSDLPGGFSEAVVLVLMMYAVGAHTAPPATYVLLATSLLVLAAVIVLGPGPHPANFVYMASVVAGSWVAGLVVRMTEERSRLLGERRALQERARIAGELHDVVSHNVSAMVIEAAAERRDQAAESPAAHTLADIERQGRETLTELRRLLGVLRVDDAAPLSPQPGLVDLERLVEASSGGDLQVVLHVEGDPQPIGAGASLAVYRVVQESITNARKHSHARTVGVVLRWRPPAHGGGDRPWTCPPDARVARLGGRAPRDGGPARGRRRHPRDGSSDAEGSASGPRCRWRPARGEAMTVRVVVADDQEVVRAGLVRILEGEPDIRSSARRRTVWPPYAKSSAPPPTSV